MRAIHNTPIPDDSGEFPIPADCVCDGDELCEACQRVIADDLLQQEEETGLLLATCQVILEEVD
jgi:hypothetical protein